MLIYVWKLKLPLLSPLLCHTVEWVQVERWFTFKPNLYLGSWQLYTKSHANSIHSRQCIACQKEISFLSAILSAVRRLGCICSRKLIACSTQKEDEWSTRTVAQSSQPSLLTSLFYPNFTSPHILQGLRIETLRFAIDNAIVSPW